MLIDTQTCSGFQVLMDPLFHLSDEHTFTDIFTVPQKGLPDPLTVTRSGKTVVSCQPGEADVRKVKSFTT